MSKLIPGTRTEEVISQEVRDFDARDSKGRVIGGRALILSFTYRALTDDEIAANSGKFGYSGTVIEPERAARTLFGMRPHALRDGAAFGAYHGVSAMRDTLEEAQADAVKYFEGAAKRAEKAGRK